MKAEDLMIGDWVYYSHTEDGIAPYKEVIRIKAEDLCCDACIIETHYEPIPLTPEILEKNGFTVGKYKIPTLDREIDKFSLSEVGNDYVREVVLLPITRNCTWSFGSVDGTFIPVIQYLHQLQHALRLCGIEKEIVL